MAEIKFEEMREVSVGEPVQSTTPSDLAQLPYGQLELNKQLYTTGLQNIFNDYQTQIQNLNQEKQSQLQDAYYIREMSKKYLGEYASNVGMGDVSGNLLDVYGKYQENLSDIERYYGDLERGFAQTFAQQKYDTMAKIMQTDFDIELSKLGASEQQVLFNISQGDFGGRENAQDYLQYAVEQGLMSEETMQTAMLTLQSADFEDIVTTVQNDLYTASGMTAEEYVTQNRGMMTDEQYDRALEVARYKDMQANAVGTEELERNVIFNLLQGNTDGLTDSEYLERELNAGNISEETYQNQLIVMQNDYATQIDTNLTSGAYMNTHESAVDYLNENREDLSPRLYDILLQKAESMDEFTQQEADIEAYATPTIVSATEYNPNLTYNDTMGKLADNPITFESAGIYYSQVKQPVGEDTYKIDGQNIKDLIDTITLNESSGGSQYYFDQSTNFWYYKDQDNKWYRMVETGFSGRGADGEVDTQLQDAYDGLLYDGSGSNDFEYRQIDTGELNRPQVKIEGIRYLGKMENAVSTTDPSIRDVWERFKQIHGQSDGDMIRPGVLVRDKSVVRFQDKYYLYVNGKIVELKKR